MQILKWKVTWQLIKLLKCWKTRPRQWAGIKKTSQYWRPQPKRIQWGQEPTPLLDAEWQRPHHRSTEHAKLLQESGYWHFHGNQPAASRKDFLPLHLGLLATNSKSMVGTKDWPRLYLSCKGGWINECLFQLHNYRQMLPQQLNKMKNYPEYRDGFRWWESKTNIK